MTIVVRPFRPESDVAAIVDVINSIETAEGRDATVTVQQMENALAAPNLFRWVAQSTLGSAPLVGYGVVFHQMPGRCYGDARVHPLWRRRGVGRMLIDRMVDKARSLDARYLAIDVAADNQDALRFLLTQNFRFRGDVWELVAPPHAELPSPRWPDGYHATTYADSPELDTYVELCNRAFGDLWGHWENFPGAVDAAHMTETLTHFDPAGIFIARDAAGNAVGQCRAKAADDEASPHILDQPAVIPAARDAGLHVPLALAAAHWLRRRDLRPVRLESWGDPAETVTSYESLGFALTKHEVSYVREFA